MKFLDITLSYHETSGGIRTYLDEKRRYLLRHTDHEHVLIIPDDHDDVDTTDRTKTYRIASPIIPGYAPYRMFWRPDKITHILDEVNADVIELGSFYADAWAVRSHIQRRKEAGERCCVGAYFHTDVAEAFVAGPLKRAVHDSVGEWMPTLEKIGYQLANFFAGSAESYIKSVFDHCDVRLAASEEQAARLNQYGVDDVQVVPLGIDLEQFHPDKRSTRIRQELGVQDDELLLVYAGRLVEEKRVGVLLNAFSKLPKELKAKLIVMGEGPMRDHLETQAAELGGATILHYEKDHDRYAALLASSDIYVTAGPFETFGLAVIEAQAAGLPVVGVQAGALIERVPSETGRLAEVDNADEFARLIEDVAQSREEMARRSREHVEQHFSWRKTFDRLLSIYEQKIRAEVPPQVV